MRARFARLPRAKRRNHLYIYESQRNHFEKVYLGELRMM